jgi:hypothetical protein
MAVANELGPYQFEIKESQLVEGFGRCILIHILEDENSATMNVPIRVVRDHLETKAPATWRFDRRQGAILAHADGREHPVGSSNCGTSLPVDRPLEAALPVGDAFPPASLAGLLVGPAAAQDGSLRVAQQLLTREQLPFVLQELEASRNTVQQQVLRDSIELGGTDSLEALSHWLAEAPDDAERQRQVALALPGLLSTDASDAAFAALDPAQKRAIASLLYAADPDVAGRAAAVLIENADASWVDPVLEAHAAAPIAESQNEALVLRTLYERAEAPGRAAIEAAIRADPRLANSPELQKVVGRVGEVPGEALGWSFYGSRIGDKWQERYYALASGDEAAVPQPGQLVTDTASVNIRSGPIEFQPKVGWVNQPSVDVARQSMRFTVLDTAEVVPGFLWVQLAPAN